MISQWEISGVELDHMIGIRGVCGRRNCEISAVLWRPVGRSHPRDTAYVTGETVKSVLVSRPSKLLCKTLSRFRSAHSTGRQEVDRVDDRDRGDVVLGAEVEGLDAIHDLLRKIAGASIVEALCSSQKDTEPSGSIVRLQDNLSTQCRVPAQLAVIQPVERRLVAIEDNLDLLVGTSGAEAPAGRGADRDLRHHRSSSRRG